MNKRGAMFLRSLHGREDVPDSASPALSSVPSSGSAGASSGSPPCSVSKETASFRRPLHTTPCRAAPRFPAPTERRLKAQAGPDALGSLVPLLSAPPAVGQVGPTTELVIRGSFHSDGDASGRECLQPSQTCLQWTDSHRHSLGLSA